MHFQHKELKPILEFFYHTDGKIRNYSQNQLQILSAFQQSEQRKRTKIYNKLDENIVQMRLCGNTLDFLQNMQKQQEFQIKPKSSQDCTMIGPQNNFNISVQLYQQSYEFRKNSSSKWLKTYRLVSILFVVLILIIVSFLIYLSYTRNNQNMYQMHVLTIIDSILQNYLDTTKYILDLKYYNNSNYDSSYISNNLKQNQNLYQQLFNIFPGTQAIISQPQYNSLIQNYLINVNNFTIYALSNKTNQFDEGLIMLNTTELDTMFDDIYSNVMDNFRTTQSIFFNNNLVLSLCLIGIVILIFIGVIFLTIFLHRKQIEILQVFLKLKDGIYIKELRKIRLFQQYFYFNKDLFSDEDLQEYSSKKSEFWQKHAIQNDKKQNYKKSIYFQKYDEQEDNSYLKTMYKPMSKKLIIFSLGIWSIIQISLAINQIIQIRTFQQIIVDMKNRKQALNQLTNDMYMGWIQLNYIPFNQENVIEFITSIDQDWTLYRTISFQYSNGIFSDQYLQFYLNFYSLDLCQYINNSVCDFSYNGMLYQGMEQVFAYIYRKLIFLSGKQSNNSTYLKQLPVSAEISDLILRYFSKNYQINEEYFSSQFVNLSNFYNSEIRINYYLFFAFLLFQGIPFWIFDKNHQKIMKMQRMLNLLQFQQVKKNKTFKKYFKKNCYETIYK